MINTTCLDCGKVHPNDGGVSYCEKCKACLYKYGTQKGIPKEDLEIFPFVKCMKCGQVNFWD